MARSTDMARSTGHGLIDLASNADQEYILLTRLVILIKIIYTLCQKRFLLRVRDSSVTWSQTCALPIKEAFPTDQYNFMVYEIQV